MKKHSSTFEVWTLEARDFSEAPPLELGAFALSGILHSLPIGSSVTLVRSVPPHLGDSAHPNQLSTETSQLSTAFKVNQASDSNQNPSKSDEIKVN
jgi:hypothetical protein